MPPYVIRPSNALPHSTKLQGGAYSIGKIIGQGGFGITYFGSDSRLHRPVAIKEFFPTGCVRQGYQVQPSEHLGTEHFERNKDQFLEEARALARFYHRNIVQALTVFEENNTAYLVMEFLKGQTFDALIANRGILPENEAIQYIEQLSEALSAIHAQEIIHRDIKPDNVIVCEDNRVVLIDFGLNKKLETIDSYGTRQLVHTTALGTTGYAPPEQYSKLVPVGKYTDIYALGATLFFLLTGETPVAALDRLQGIQLKSPQSINPSISDSVSQTIIKSLEIERTARHQTVQEFVKCLMNSSQFSTGNLQFVASSSMTKVGLIHKLTAHREQVEALKFSPDGRVIASVGRDNQIILWNVQTGRLIQTLGCQKKLTSVAFSPDGETLCAGTGDCRVLHWETKSGKLLKTFVGHRGTVNSVAFSGRGDTIVSAAKDGSTKLWEVETGKELQNACQRDSEIVCVDISSDGILVATLTYDSVLIWNIQNGSVLQIAESYAGFNSLSFSPNGSLLVVGCDRAAKIWDVQTGELILNFSKHRGWVTDVAFSRDGNTAASGSSNGIIKLWDVYSGQVLQTFKQDSWHTKIALSPSGTMLAAAGEYNNTIKVWSFEKSCSVNFSGQPIPLASPSAPKRTGRRIHNMDDFVELWPAVLVRIKKKVGVTAVGYLAKAKPALLTDKYAVLEVEGQFEYEKAREAARRLPFEQVINECFATPRQLLFRLHDSENS